MDVPCTKDDEGGCPLCEALGPPDVVELPAMDARTMRAMTLVLPRARAVALGLVSEQGQGPHLRTDYGARCACGHPYAAHRESGAFPVDGSLGHVGCGVVDCACAGWERGE